MGVGSPRAEWPEYGASLSLPGSRADWRTAGIMRGLMRPSAARPNSTVGRCGSRDVYSDHVF